MNLTTTATPLKEEMLRWIFSILGAVLIYYIIASIVHNVYHPDIELLNKKVSDLLIEPFYARPEPMEAMLFRLGVLTIVPATLGLYALLSRTKWISSLAGKPAYLLITGACLLAIAALIYFDFTAANPYGPLSGEPSQNKRDVTSATNFDFYFADLFVGNYLLFYVFVIVPLIACIFFIGIKKKNWEQNKMFTVVSSVAGYGLIALVIAVIVAMNIFYAPYRSENKIDLTAVYYSMTQVYAGLPMLVNRFTNTYGLYPHFLNPLFQVIGLNVLKFSMVMSLLTGLSFIMNLYALRKLVSNNIILFLGFTTIMFFPYLDFKFTTIFDSVFSYYPIRYLVPSVLIFLSVLYFFKKSALRYWATFFISACLILWNPEIGLVCYISWILVNIYSDFYGPDGKPAIKKMLSHVIAGIIIVFAVFYTYKLLIYIAYGAWPDLSLLFTTITLFGNLGVGALPMSLVHPWNIMALILILGFTYPVVKWFKKEITPKSTLLMLVSLIGLGYFVYFQGRSQNTNFAFSSCFSLFVLTILADELWATARKTNDLLLNGLFVICLLIVSFSAFEIAYGQDKMKDLVFQEADKAEHPEEQELVDGDVSFIVDNTNEHESIHILARRKYQALFFDGNKRRSAFNPGNLEVFFKTDIARLEDILIDSPSTVFMEAIVNAYPFMERSYAAAGASYTFGAANGKISKLTKRKIRNSEATFFTDTQQAVLHRKYTDDRAGMKRRVDDAEGIAPVAPGPEFSVSVLFFSSFQIFLDATLVGNANRKDSSGFTIAHLLNTSKYYFTVNSTSISTPVPNNTWVYLVANAYTDHVNIFINGSLAAVGALKGPIRTSAKKVSVGNHGEPGEFRDFIGAISEVAIVNKVQDSIEIKNKWLEIKQTLQK